MAEILLQDGCCISLGSIDSEEDLKPRPGININPPPSDGRCNCCGRHVNELKPFGKAEDPLLGDFDSALLVKTWRAFGPRDEEAEKIYEKYLGNGRTEPDRERAEQLMALDYGEEEAERIIFAVQAAGQVGSSWECRDCIILDGEEYFEKLWKRQETGI